MKYSIKELKELIADKKESSIEYRKHGQIGIANDESKHAFYLSKELERRTKK